MPLLQVRSIVKLFDDKKVLSHFSLTVQKGEWIGVLGESGSGKSTLLKIIARHLDADQGRVDLHGTPLPLVREQLIKGHKSIKLVQQEYDLFPNQTARENIAYALRFYDREYREQKVDELVALIRLSDVEHHKTKVLSGGEKQRTALAQALAEVPELLLLDEPFAHLDQRNKQTLASAIEDLKSTHQLTCIFVTHDAEEAMAWADRLIILKDGQIAQEGTPEEIYENPADVYVAELTGPVNLIERGREGTWLIRPNFIRLMCTADKAKWTGRISKIRFKGAGYEYYCETTDGNSLVFYRNRRDRELGDTVYLSCAEKYWKQIERRG
jgi:ABC-type Fe3+/spermidine/putrescine transport system ATPase subunit